MQTIPLTEPLWPLTLVRHALTIVGRFVADPLTLVTLTIVVALLYAPAWVPAIVYAVTHNPAYWSITLLYVAFWAGPGTPFWPLAITITIVIRNKLFPRRNKYKHDNYLSRRHYKNRARGYNKSIPA